MKEIKKFCNDDDNCVLIILVLTGFLLCMFFNREGFTLDDVAAPIDGSKPTEGPNGSGTGPTGTGPTGTGPTGTGPTGTGATEEVLGMKPPQQVPKNGYGSVQQSVEQLRKQPQMDGRGGGQVQKPGLTQYPSAYLQLPATAGYSFTEFMGSGEPSQWPKDRPIGKVPTPIETPETPGAPSVGTGPVPADGAKKVMTLVLFYAPWCGHSRNMLEDYDAVIDEYHGKTKDGISYEVIKIDMDKDKDAAKRYEVEVKGFPTLYTFYTVGDKKIKKIFNHRTKDEIIMELEKRGQEIN